MKGHALRLTAVRELTLETVEVGEPPPGFVRCRVQTAGVCGTDLHLWNGRDELPLPHVLGHDFAGRVDKLGAGVDEADVPLGVRITANPSNYCGSCGACRRGVTNLCVRGTVMGMSEPGCFQEFLTLRADRLVMLPDGVDDVTAAVLEPVALGLHIVDRAREQVPHGMAVVLGAGPVGLVAGRLLLAAGYQWVCVEPLAERRDMARRWGAVDAFDRDQDEAVRGRLGDAPAVFVAAIATPSVAEVVVRLAPRGSAVLVVGNTPSAYPSSAVMLRELSVLGVRGGVRYGEAARLIDAGIVDPGSLVSEVRPLEDAAGLFAELDERAGSLVRAVLSVSHE